MDPENLKRLIKKQEKQTKKTKLDPQLVSPIAVQNLTRITPFVIVYGLSGTKIPAEFDAIVQLDHTF